MNPHQTRYEPFRHSRSDFDADAHMHPSADDETLLKLEDYARQHHALNQPRSHSARRANDHTRHAPFQAARTILRILSLFIAITILGIQAYSMYTWLKTRNQTARNSTTGLQTKIWAVIDPWPTWVMLGAAVAASVVHLIAFGSLCGCVRYPSVSLRLATKH
jgi:hypothetical protein